MNIDSVRALKEEVATEIVPPAIAEIHAAGGFSITTFSLDRMTSAEPQVALGVAPGKKPADVRLAVRLQRRSLERSKPLIEKSASAPMTRSKFALSEGSRNMHFPGTAHDCAHCCRASPSVR